jgi:hypothetical protein
MSEIKLEVWTEEFYRHKKTGEVYEYIGIAKNKTDEDTDPMLIYRKVGTILPLYCRTLTDFNEKFYLVREVTH